MPTMLVWASCPPAPLRCVSHPSDCGCVTVFSCVGRQEHMAMEMTRASGGRADAQRYSRLINEHARSAASGDRYALDRAFQVCIFVGVRMHAWVYACMRVCVRFHASFSLSCFLSLSPVRLRISSWPCASVWMTPVAQFRGVLTPSRICRPHTEFARMLNIV